MTRKKSKIFVLDTSVLLHDHQAITNFASIVEDKDVVEMKQWIPSQSLDYNQILPFEHLEIDASWLPKVSNGQRLPLSLLPELKLGQRILLMHNNTSYMCYLYA